MTGEATYGYADTAYDALGRVRTVTTLDGAVVTTSYSANATTVTDQAGKTRRSIADGLGRLIRIDEPDSSGSLGTVASPTQPTSYVYDVLDDLTGVSQGSQTRSFTYDSLKRLKQAINPESGTMNYTYDANSNLQTKQDARSITTTYFYDALNRVTKRTYSDSTPEVDYYYDNQTLPTTKPPNFAPAYSKGRLIAVCYGGPTSSAGSYQSYDQLGRVTSSYQQTDSINYGFGYGYNLASAMTSETYPSGRQMITEYDTAGRAAGIRSATIYYAGATATDTTSRIQYAPQGAVSVMKLGNGKWEHTNFNSRLQPTQIGLGTSGTDSSILRLDYEYTSSCQTGNNGNVLKQTINASGLILTQNYCYDALNRLSSASENSGASWSQSYGFDRFGNRWMSGYIVPGNESRTPPNANAFNQGNNRIQLSGFDYDFAGNLKNDPTTPANAILYDAENRQISFTKSGTTTYSYDGDGHRVKKVAGSVTTVFVYNASGQLTAEYTNDTTPPVGGGGTSYLTSDHLGSTRVVTKSDGSVKARYDYLPFGEELGSGIGGRTTGIGYSAADSTKQKFTQKERDSESGLDYFLARYYSSAQGRFTSVDPLMASGPTMSPQSWNRYSYVFNNPLVFVDPTGQFADFYDQSGNRLGTDGNNDGRVYVVTDKKEVKNIEQNNKKGGTTQVSSVGSAIELPSFNARQEIGGAAVDRSNRPAGGDTQGGFHEEGGIVGKDANGQELIIPAAPGPVSNPLRDTDAHINVFNAADPSQLANVASVNLTYHVHPSGQATASPNAPTGTTVIGGETTGSFRQEPSRGATNGDIYNAGQRQASMGISSNIVVGAGNKRVYFYNGSGVRATFPLDKFRSVR